DRPGELDGVPLRLLAHRLGQLRLRVLDGQAADLLEGQHALLVEPVQVLAALVELDLLLEQLPIALLEHVRALVQLLVAGVQATLQIGQLAAPLTGLFLGLADQADLLLLGLEDQVLLPRIRVGDDARGLLGRSPDRLACQLAPDDVAQAEPNGKADQRPKAKGESVHLHPPIRSFRPDALLAAAKPTTGRSAPRAVPPATTRQPCRGSPANPTRRPARTPVEGPRGRGAPSPRPAG